MIILYIYTLKLEGQSKINSLPLYTLWYFFPMALLYLLSGSMISFYFNPELVALSSGRR